MRKKKKLNIKPKLEKVLVSEVASYSDDTQYMTEEMHIENQLRNMIMSRYCTTTFDDLNKFEDYDFYTCMLDAKFEVEARGDF